MGTGALYLLTVLIWGTTWLAVKWQLNAVAPELSVFYRFALAFLVLLVFCKIQSKRFSFTLKQHFVLFLLGICVFSVHVLLFYKASFYLVSGCVSVLFSFVSVFNLINAVLFLNRRPTSFMLVGSGLGILGLVTFFWQDVLSLSFTDSALVGILEGLVGSYLFSLGNMLSRSFQQQKIDLISSSTVAVGYGTIVLLCYCLYSGVDFAFPSSISYWGLLIYLGVFVSAVGFVSFLNLVSRLGPELAGYATVLFPVIALSLSSLFEDYRFSWFHYLGASCVIGGNILMVGKKKQVYSSSYISK